MASHTDILSHTDEGSNWPKAIQDDYERIRPLGEGAFGVVWLAKDRRRPPIEEAPSSAPPSSYVAIKQIRATEETETRYARREIAILTEANHPNIVRCLRSTTMPHRGIVAVLTFADGPDLGQVVERGGALGVGLARLAARHLISAVAYLHGRGVIHRDIKPDNCIVTKTNAHTHGQSSMDDWITNDVFWQDDAVFDEWKIVLVDFGFAKALTPVEIGLHKDPQMSMRHMVQRGVEEQASECAWADELDDVPQKRASSSTLARKRRLSSMSSFERRAITAMSALGTGAYAAPEVRRAREKSEEDGALTDNVSDYGMMADAYSIGRAIRVLLTGVPADRNEMEYIGSQNGVLSCLSAAFSCGKKDGRRRRKRHKFLDECPKPAQDLVTKLTRPSIAERLAVPLAREEPWIMGGMSPDDPVIELPTGDIPAGNDDPIKCLDCAISF